MTRGYTVNAIWDDEAKVWVAESDDVPGLATGADTLEALIEKLRVVIPELLEANGVLTTQEAGEELPFTINATRIERTSRAA